MPLKKLSNNHTRNNRLNTDRGMTLMEILIAMMIIVGLFAIGASFGNSSNSKIRAGVRKLGTVIKKTRVYSRLYNTTYRLVIDLGNADDEDDKKVQSYWVEKGSGTFLMESISREERLKKELEAAEKAKDLEEEGTPVKKDFTMEAKITKKKSPLPAFMIFDSIELKGEDKEIKDGKVYIYFLPQGWNQEAMIHLKYLKTKLEWSLYLHPITGKIKVLGKNVPLSEISKD